MHGLFHSRKEPWADDPPRPKWLPESLLEGRSVRLLAFSYQSVIDKDIIHTRVGLEDAAQNLLDALMEHRTEEREVRRPFRIASIQMDSS